MDIIIKYSRYTENINILLFPFWIESMKNDCKGLCQLLP